jgi:hypothetical protein
MARQQLSSPFQSFLAGRDARQQHDYGQTRNKLAEMELADAPAQMQRRNALADVQMQGAQTELQGQQQQLGAEKAKFAYAKLKQAQDSGNPKAFILQQIPDLAAQLQRNGVDLNSMDDESVAQLTDQLTRKYAGEAGIAPAQPKTPESFTLGAGQTRYGPDGKPIASAPVSNAMTPYQQERLKIEREKLSKPSPSDTGPLVQVAGPDGNPVYKTREDAVNQPAYVARDKPAAADLKYQREVKAKIPRLKAASRRLERLNQAVVSVGKNAFFDGGPLDAKALRYTKQGQELTQAQAQLLPELTALTRVPGIGSQSDLETRLASLQFPSAEFAPEVNAKAVEELNAFIRDLGDAYGVVEGEFQSGPAQQPAPAQAGAPKPGTIDSGYRFKGGDPSDQANWEKT